jgi:hypothetical protein
MTPSMKPMQRLFAIGMFVAVATFAHAAVIDAQLKSATVFFFASTNSSGAGATPLGTGFYVATPYGTNGNAATLLITARHVIHDANGNPGTNDFLWVRAGLRDTNMLAHWYLPLRGLSAIPTYVHPDPSVDLAALLFATPIVDGDVRALPIDMFLSENAVRNGTIVEGDEVFFSGLFISHYGDKRNIPIFRVSMLSPEPINWMGRKTDLYLIETLCFGGNSGSPVFLEHGVNRRLGQLIMRSQMFVAGVLIGHFNDVQPVGFANVSTIAIERNNNGIAAVVPAYRVRELLDHPHLKKMREDAIVADNTLPGK